MIVDTMRTSPRRQALRDALQQLRIPRYECLRLLSLADAVVHPLLEEIEICCELRNHFSDVFSNLVDSSGVGDEGTPAAYEITLSAGFGPMDVYYQRLHDDAQGRDGYRWESLLTWTWRIDEHGLDPSCGSGAWTSSGYDIPPWAASKITVGFLAPDDEMYKIYQEAIELSGAWHFEFADPEVVEGLGIARRYEF